MSLPSQVEATPLPLPLGSGLGGLLGAKAGEGA